MPKIAVQVLLGNGDGTFTVKNPTMAPAGNVLVGDVTGDGKIDVVVDSPAAKSLLVGKGDGTFAAPAAIQGVAGAIVAIADFNGDKKADLVVQPPPPAATTTTGTTSTVTPTPIAPPSLVLRLSNGDGTFAAVKPIVLPTGVTVFGDLNGDGKADAIVTLPPVATPATATTPVAAVAKVFLGKGDGTFAAPILL